MKKIVRRNHIKENFRANLAQEKSNINEALPVLGWMAANALVNVGVRYGPSIVSKLLGGAAKARVPTGGAAKARVPNTGRGPWGPRRGGGGGRGGKGRPKGKDKGSQSAAAVAGAAGGAAAAGSGITVSPLDVLAKERPQTGFRDKFQGINPFHSGEGRASAGYYSTQVGIRDLYKTSRGGGGLVAPPMYEQLQEMVSKSIRAREINDILVTQDMAKNIVQLHEALNNDNKKILEENIQTKDGFFRTLDFSVRN